jgi:hypothetical protein
MLEGVQRLGGIDPVRRCDFLAAERRNQPPFTRPPAQRVAPIMKRGGFGWTDGAIGGAAGVGIALSAGVSLSLARRTPRPA